MQQRPQDVSSHILSTIREIIERSLRRNTNATTNIRSTAITVPANYSMLQKKALLEAAHSAGLVNVHLVTDPIACIRLKHITSTHGRRKDFSKGEAKLQFFLLFSEKGGARTRTNVAS